MNMNLFVFCLVLMCVFFCFPSAKFHCFIVRSVVCLCLQFVFLMHGNVSRLNAWHEAKNIETAFFFFASLSHVSVQLVNRIEAPLFFSTLFEMKSKSIWIEYTLLDLSRILDDTIKIMWWNHERKVRFCLCEESARSKTNRTDKKKWAMCLQFDLLCDNYNSSCLVLHAKGL